MTSDGQILVAEIQIRELLTKETDRALRKGGIRESICVRTKKRIREQLRDALIKRYKSEQKYEERATATNGKHVESRLQEPQLDGQERHAQIKDETTNEGEIQALVESMRKQIQILEQRVNKLEQEKKIITNDVTDCEKELHKRYSERVLLTRKH